MYTSTTHVYLSGGRPTYVYQPYTCTYLSGGRPTYVYQPYTCVYLSGGRPTYVYQHYTCIPIQWTPYICIPALHMYIPIRWTPYTCIPALHMYTYPVDARLLGAQRAESLESEGLQPVRVGGHRDEPPSTTVDPKRPHLEARESGLSMAPPSTAVDRPHTAAQ